MNGGSLVRLVENPEGNVEVNQERHTDEGVDTGDTVMGAVPDQEEKKEEDTVIPSEGNKQKDLMVDNSTDSMDSEGDYEVLWKALKEINKEKGTKRGNLKGGRKVVTARLVPLDEEKILLEENPFESQFSILKKNKETFELGHEVSFEGDGSMIGEGSRGPKKKKKPGRLKPVVDAENRNPNQSEDEWMGVKGGGCTEKRRVLGMMDTNGCRYSVRSESVSEMEDGEVRERKMRDNGLMQVIGLQEVKSDKWRTNKWLSRLKKKGTVVFDKPIGSKGGTALIFHESVEVTAKGTGGHGRLAWAKVKVQNILGGEEWIVLGDFNQVEMQEDARGKSTVVKGREERAWKQLNFDKGLVDGFFCAASIEGVRFTRMARRRSRYDWSRLDRFYLTRGADWIDHIRQVTHFSSSSISDHCPIVMDVQVVPEDETRKHESYFKMNHFDLGDADTMKKVREAWVNEAEIVKDNRRKWARGWNRVKLVLKEAREVRDRKRREEGNLANEVAWRKERISVDSSIEEVEALTRAEARLRARELQDAREWRARSREKWLKVDEAPSRYFFAKMKANWAREKIEALVNTEGEVTTNRDEILDEITEFYQNLYSAEEENTESEEAREEVVGLLQQGITPEESRSMSTVPEKKEIEAVIFGMRTNKAPGLDGVTIEVLQACWEFVGEDFVRLIQTIWAKRRLLKSDCQAVISYCIKVGIRKY
ncbi:hypothetical protein R1sor_016014 [Riccia sorocarpa]|uniref:Endonuclease/exonuclease/phosphatase domain-containing protein n=1 Tax=Riccia sorocarpa TaxID=122646 RepID=A0ABD3HHW0_9MARC